MSGDFKPIKKGYGVQPIEKLKDGGDIHDTFQVNKVGDILNGHTTVRIHGGKSIKMPWDGSKK